MKIISIRINTMKCTTYTISKCVKTNENRDCGRGRGRVIRNIVLSMMVVMRWNISLWSSRICNNPHSKLKFFSYSLLCLCTEMFTLYACLAVQTRSAHQFAFERTKRKLKLKINKRCEWTSKHIPLDESEKMYKSEKEEGREIERREANESEHTSE